MVNNLKIKKYWITTLCMVFCSLASFAQDLSDATIGFDVANYTAFLKNRGVADKDMNTEISKLRDIQLSNYLELKKVQDGILQKKIEEEKLKTNYSNTGKSAFVDIPQSERDALIALYNSTNGANWTNTKSNYKIWDVTNPSSDVSTWNGITVTNGHVTRIIDILNAIGTIPDLSSLQNLQELYILTGSFTGNLNGLQNLTNLQKLRISSNSSFPKSNFDDLSPITKLSNLSELCLWYCNFNSKSIPDGFQNLSNLQKLEINYGNVNLNWDRLGNLTQLTHLQLIYNNFNVQDTALIIPSNFANLTNLEILDLSNNKIQDISVIANMKSLKFLGLQNNEITTFPSGFSALTKLNMIRLAYNKFKGSIPSYFQNFQFHTVSIDQNEFEGTIPPLDFNLTYTTFRNYIAGSGADYGTNRGFGFTSNRFRFIDFSNQFEYYKTRMAPNYFSYRYQLPINKAETITKGTGQSITLKMFPDGDDRYLPNDTFKWYKNYIEINGATGPTYTIPSLKTTDAAIYTCNSYHNSDPDMSLLVLSRQPITLKVLNCTPATGSITSTSEKFYTNTESSFTFETTATGLTYEWSVATAAGTPVNAAPSNTIGSYSYTFSEAGDYIVNLIAKDANGCATTFTKPLQVIVERYCAKEPINFGFETTTPGLTYTWNSSDASGTIVHTATNTTGLYTFIPQLGGEYEVELIVNTATSCKTLFTKNITVEDCTPIVSCTANNPITQKVHSLFINLITKLVSTPNGTDANMYARNEIIALSSYVAGTTNSIYNFSNSGAAVTFSFSQNGAENDVYIPKSASGAISGIDLSKYFGAQGTTAVTTNYSNGSNGSGGYVRNIDFCPIAECIPITGVINIVKKATAQAKRSGQSSTNAGSKI